MKKSSPAPGTLRLNYRRTAQIGFAFFGILRLWQVYDSWCPTFLTDIFARNIYNMSSAELKASDPSKILNVQCDRDGLYEIASRSRGTPRIANRMLKRVRDFAQVKGDGVINLSIAQEALNQLNVDELGLDRVDRNVLTTMMDKFGGGPVGLDTLAASTGEDAGTIEDVYEPYLLQLGFIMRTTRGRVLTPAAYAHLGRTFPENNQESQNQQTTLF